jgi:hypothetical protein
MRLDEAIFWGPCWGENIFLFSQHAGQNFFGTNGLRLEKFLDEKQEELRKFF